MDHTKKLFLTLAASALMFSGQTIAMETACGYDEEPAPVVEAPVYETITFQAGALFDFDKSNIKPAGAQELDAFVMKLQDADVQSDMLITGHTDSVGSDAYNQALSLRRANAVADYLVNAGVSRDLITVKGMGESKPVASNDTAEGRAKNRRVEIMIEVSKTVEKQ